MGTVLTSVTANDVDTYPALKYSIIRGDSTFSIDKYSGKVVLNRPLDFETKKLYELNITASDNEHVAKTTLTIKVTDINDNSPIFDDISYNRILPGNYLSYFKIESLVFFCKHVIKRVKTSLVLTESVLGTLPHGQ